MPHLDEGTLHALLDNELDATVRITTERHLEGCGSCRERFDIERALRRDASELLASLAPGSIDAPPFAELAARATLRDGGETAPSAGAPAAARRDHPAARGWIPALAWAATVAFAFGLGWLVAPGTVEVASAPVEVVDAAPLPSTAEAPAHEARTDADRIEPAFRAAIDEASPGRDDEAPARDSDVADTRQQLASEPEVVADAMERKAQAVEGPDPLPVTMARAPEPEARAAELAEEAPRETDTAPAGRGQAARVGEVLAAAGDVARRENEEAGAATEGLREVNAPEAALEFFDEISGAIPELSGDALLPDRSVAIDLADVDAWLGAPPKLLAGAEPIEVFLAPGEDLPGVDPRRPAIAIVYRLASGETVELTQQSPETAAITGSDTRVAPARRRDKAQLRAARPPAPGEPEVLVDPSGVASIAWTTDDGYRIVLRGTMDIERLSAIARDVR